MPDASTVISPGSTPAKRACDACHRRKVKCIGNGAAPCKNCSTAGLRCTYDAIPQKKGPKGSRAKVISELRERQQKAALASPQSISPSASPPHFLRAPQLLSSDLIATCVDNYFTHLHPSQPFLRRKGVQEAIVAMDQSVEAYSFIVSLCALMLLQPNLPLQGTMNGSAESTAAYQAALGRSLLGEVARGRRYIDMAENSSLWTVFTSYFLYGSHFSQEQYNTAWFHLREATTLALSMEMHIEDSYKALEPALASSRRRMYWQLFITERSFAIQRHRPVSLPATIETPKVDEEPSASLEVTGFCHMIQLFRPFNETFIGLWNKFRGRTTTAAMTELQRQLTDALPTYLPCSDAQAVLLRISQQWLRTMVWQLSISQGWLSSTSADTSMTFHFPITIAEETTVAASQFPQQALEVHGIGLVEKLFDIACALTDVMTLIPMDQSAFDYRPSHCLSQLVGLIGTLRGGSERLLPLLLDKIKDTIPTTAVAIHTKLTPQIRASLHGTDTLPGPQEHPISTSSSSDEASSTPLSYSATAGASLRPDVLAYSQLASQVQHHAQIFTPGTCAAMVYEPASATAGAADPGATYQTYA